MFRVEASSESCTLTSVTTVSLHFEATSTAGPVQYLHGNYSDVLDPPSCPVSQVVFRCPFTVEASGLPM